MRITSCSFIFFRPEQLWILNPKKLITTFQGDKHRWEIDFLSLLLLFLKALVKKMFAYK